MPRSNVFFCSTIEQAVAGKKLLFIFNRSDEFLNFDIQILASLLEDNAIIVDPMNVLDWSLVEEKTLNVITITKTIGCFD